MIGIVTPYKIPNYGTKLQAYAMQELMLKYDDAEILGFVPSTDMRFSSIIGKIYLKLLRVNSSKKNGTENEKRNAAINSFDKEYRFGEKIEGNITLKKKIRKYKSVVCGSDQLWAPTNVIADYFTLSIIPNEINRFSYAASFGVSEIPSRLHNRYKRFLSRLNNIAVRENRGVEIVKELSGREAELVLDPTLMVDTEKWKTLSSKSEISINQPYLFCYFLGENEFHREVARKIACEKGIKIATFPHLKKHNTADENFGDYSYFDATPIDFLNLIKNASFVCTDSFHGTVFSILFSRNFYAFERFKNNTSESTNNRIYSLLEILDLQDRLISDRENIKEDGAPYIDYTKVYEKLSYYRQKSFRYIEKSLNIAGRI